MLFYANAEEYLRISSSGNVGIGTLAPSQKLHVQGNTTISGSLTALLLSASQITVTAGNSAVPAISPVNDTNTGIYFPAADNIALVEGGEEVVRINQGGFVGIGTTNPQAPLVVSYQGKQGIETGWSTGSQVGFLQCYNRNTTSYDTLHISASAIVLNAGSPTASERLRIDSSGNVLIGKNSATANGGDLQISGGITFPASQSAKSDANTLDDYEEGTWTPRIDGSTTAGTGTYVQQVGVYTKIGNLVTLQIWVQWSAHTGTGNLTIANLPFAATGTANYRGSGVVSVSENLALSDNTKYCSGLVITPNSANLQIVESTVGGGAAAVLIAMDTAANIHCGITYQT